MLLYLATHIPIIIKIVSLLGAALCMTSYGAIRLKVEDVSRDLGIRSRFLKNAFTGLFFLIVLAVGAGTVLSLYGLYQQFVAPTQTEAAPNGDACEAQAVYDGYKSAGKSGLIAYIDKCSAHITPFTMDAKNSLEQIESDAVRVCIRANGCNAMSCLNDPHHLSPDRLDAFNAQAERQANVESCKPRPSVPPNPVPKPTITPLPAPSAAPARQRKLNLSTQAHVPLSVGKQSGFQADYRVSETLARELQAKGFSVVNDASLAALRVEIIDVTAQADPTDRRFSNSYYTSVGWFGDSDGSGVLG
jgi:hypothetical protein